LVRYDAEVAKEFAGCDVRVDPKWGVSMAAA
jgi:hypothetical protein